MNLIKKFAFSMACALGVSAFGLQDAEAATCSAGAVSINLYGDADACAGAYVGNDTGASSTFLADLNAGTIFAGFGSATLGSMWSLLGKSDDGNASVQITSGAGTSTGKWSANPVKTNTVVTIKAGNCFSAFLFSPLTSTSVSGEWNTSDTGITVGGKGSAGTCDGKNVPDISHLSVFVADSLVPAPLPAAGWLLLASVGGLAAWRRKKA